MILESVARVRAFRIKETFGRWHSFAPNWRSASW
jgi:hypothetical protein